MTDKVTINPLVTGFRSLEQYNANLAALAAGLDNTVSRDGTAPNQMEANFDMNGNRIINLPAPVGSTDPVRLEDLQAAQVVTTAFTRFIINTGGVVVSVSPIDGYCNYGVQTANGSAQFNITMPIIANLGAILSGQTFTVRIFDVDNNAATNTIKIVSGLSDQFIHGGSTTSNFIMNTNGQDIRLYANRGLWRIIP